MFLSLRKFAFITCVLFLTGCASTNNMTDRANISSGKGVMVVSTEIAESALLKWVAYDNEVTLAESMVEIFTWPAGALHVKEGKKYWVLSVKPGDYMWGDVTLLDRYPEQTASFHSTSRFEIKENAVNYVGHVKVEAKNHYINMGTYNKLDEAKEFLNENYPALMSENELLNASKEL